MADFQIEDSPEFQRILALPRRSWEERATANDLHKRMTAAFRLPHGKMELRPIQAAALADAHDIRGLLGAMSVGSGKAQPDTEPVLLERGWTPIGEVLAGDKIYGSEGCLHTVLGVYPQGMRPTYKITFSDRTYAFSDIDHLWTFDSCNTRHNPTRDHRTKTKADKTRSLREWLKEPLFRRAKTHKIRKMYLPRLLPIQRPAAQLPVDPYTLGALLGDGGLTTVSAYFTSMDADIVAALQLFDSKPVPTKHQNSGRATHYLLTRGRQGKKGSRGQNQGKGLGKGFGGGAQPSPLLEALRSVGAMGKKSIHKSIPDVYKNSSVAQRLELLRGLLDTDGEVIASRAGFASASTQLAEDVAEIVESLGGTATRSYRHNHVRVSILLPRDMIPFKCARKRDPYVEQLKTRQRDVFRAVDKIEYVGFFPSTCIHVDAPDHLYVTRFHILTHNTLVSYLLPAIIPGVQRPLLLLPAALVDKTWREFKQLRNHWICHQSFMTEEKFRASVITYQALGRDSGFDALKKLRPDIVICDEVHKLANRDAAVTKKMFRHMIANPDTIFCGVSGTITKRSILDYWHIIYWALKHHMPLPRTEKEAESWAEVLDERKIEAVSRRGSGMLMRFVSTEDMPQQPVRTAAIGRTQQMPNMFFEDQLAAVRKGYQRRLQESPGVISSTEQSVGASLVMRRLPVTPGPRAAEHLKVLRETGCNPDGDKLPTPMDVWRVARQIVCDFVYRWDPPPPKAWLSARKAWNWYVYEILAPDGSLREQYQHLHLDSPMQVALAVTGRTYKQKVQDWPERFPDETEDEYTDRVGSETLDRIHNAPEKTFAQSPTITDPYIAHAYSEWAAIRGSYKINTVPEWLDDTTLRYCVDWTRSNGPGIVWTEHRAFGIRLAEMLGTGFCSNGGLDANGKMIEDYDGKTVVASVAANCEGRNLQAWNKNLIVTVLPTGRIVEQLLGRTHRQGQLADTVYVDWIAACAEQDQGFQQMMADARYIQDTTGASQKLLYADHI